MKKYLPSIFAVIACSILIGCTPAILSKDPGSGDLDDQIVFYSERDGDAEIYLMNLNGSGQRPITDNSADDLSPVWSPDHTQIVFESDRNDADPRSCFPNCNYDLFVMNADGSNQTQITSLLGAEWSAAWSPEGTRLVFTAGEIGFQMYTLYIYDFQTGEVSPLLEDGYLNTAADWSPDGNLILFESNRDGGNDIFVMDADGTNIRKIIDTGLNDYDPHWSPDGSRILFMAADFPSVKQDLYLMNSDGTGLMKLTDTTRIVDETASWSPDGTQILFQTDRDRNFEIYMMNADGSDPVNLTNNAGRDYWPDW